MLHLIISLVTIAVPSLGQEALPVAPLDVTVGHQVVELRKPLVARAVGARLVLYVRGAVGAADTAASVQEQFKAAVPEGSVSAFLTGADGERIRLEHTGYSFYRGYKGLLLTSPSLPHGTGSELYRHLELDAKLALDAVRIAWLERAALQVWDVHPGL